MMKKGFHFLWLVCSIAIAMVSCGGEEVKKKAPIEIQNTEVFDQPDFATGFSMSYQDGFKVLRVVPNWMDSGKHFEYVLYPKGTNKPQWKNATAFVETPVQSIAALSSIFCAHLEAIDGLEYLKAVDKHQYINSEKVLSLCKSGTVKSIGSGAELNLEMLIDLNPDVCMTFGTGDASYDVHPLLEKSGLPVVVVVDYQEKHPLGRAEWMKFTAAFLNKEKEAELYFNAVSEAYLETVVKTTSADACPDVFVSAPYSGSWYVSGGDSYTAKILKDAGACYLWQDAKSQGSLQLSYEEAYDKGLNADYWINTGTWTSKADAIKADSRNAHFSAFKNDKMYNNNARVNAFGGNDIWESAVVRPDLVLKDLTRIFHPELLPAHQLYYYQKLQ